MRRKPLPPALTRGPFLARESNLPARRLRAGDLDKSIWGVRTVNPGPDELRARCAAFALRLRDDAFFSHTTAALLLGAPLSLELERDPALHISVASPNSTPRARGIRGHRLEVLDGDIVRSRGLRQTSAARTWCDLASILSLGDLVAVGDHFIHWRATQVTLELLRERVSRMSGRGLRRAQEALDLLNDRAESRPESLLRVILVRGGLGLPEINYVLIDTETGKEARPDFLYRSLKLIIEYQGDYHRTLTQWRKDMTRRTRLEVKGWYVMEINAADLDDPVELIARIRGAMARQR